MRKWIKRIGITLGALVALVLLAATGVSLVGRARLNDTFPVPRQALAALPLATASAERGEHIMRTRACQECHGDNLAGKLWLDIPPGAIVAPNLTPGRGGVGARYSEADFVAAFRHGLRPNGQWLLPFMPYRLYSGLSDADAADLAAYLEALPPVDNELPATRIRFPGYLMLGLPSSSPEKLREGLDAAPPPAPPVGETPEYGRYLASSTCVECHGRSLEGGTHPDPSGPPVPGLSHTSQWSFEEFATALRTGKVPGGRTVKTQFMPIRFFGHLTDSELRALRAYIATLQPGAPPTTAR